LVTGTRPRAHPAPYLPRRLAVPSGTLATAAPPCISGRTSYLRVRLEFLPYPQVIPHFCNSGGCGPRRGLTPASPCPWIAHPVSGLLPATKPYAPALFRPGSPGRRRRPPRLAFAAAPRLCPPLNLVAWRPARPTRSPPRATRRIILQKARRHPPPRPPKGTGGHSGSDCWWVRGFRFSFIPLPGCFSPFPHGTRALSVASGCFALEGGPPSFPQDFPCPVVLRYRPHRASRRRLPGSHRLRRRFPAASADTTG
jgi:hypothetical protein